MVELNLDYICLAPGFAREVLDVYQSWDGKETVPWKIKELMMVLRLEVSRRYKPGILPVEAESQKSAQGHQIGLNVAPRGLYNSLVGPVRCSFAVV